MKQLALCAGPEENKQAILSFCSGDKNALDNMPYLMKWYLRNCNNEIKKDVETIMAYYQKQEMEESISSINEKYWKYEPQREDKIDIIARPEYFGKVLNDMRSTGVSGEDNVPYKTWGNMLIYIGAILVMIDNKYFRESVLGKKVKKTDIIRFMQDNFNCGSVQQIYRAEEKLERYKQKALAKLKTLTTNEQKH